MHSAKIASKVRIQIRQFPGEVSVGLPKTAVRLVREVIYGVQCRPSARISAIVQAWELGIWLKKVMEGLSRQLNRRVELTRFRGYIQNKGVKGRIHDGKKAAAVPTKVPAVDRWAGGLGAFAGVAA